MATTEALRIEDELLSEHHIQGRPISVRQVYALVENRGVDLETVADRCTISTSPACITR